MSLGGKGEGDVSILSSQLIGVVQCAVRGGCESELWEGVGGISVHAQCQSNNVSNQKEDWRSMS